MAAVEAALATEEKTFLVAAQKDGDSDQPELRRPVHRRHARRHQEDGPQRRRHRADRPGRRARPPARASSRPSRSSKVRYEPYPLPDDAGTELEALQRAVVDLALKVLELAEVQTPVTIQQLVAQAQDPLRFAFLLGSMLSLDVAKEQALLEATTRPRGADAAARLPDARGAGAGAAPHASRARPRRR